LLSKIVVVVREYSKTDLGSTSIVTDTWLKEYSNSKVYNNERGELVIQNQKGETIAVFKEWIYWEKVEENEVKTTK
jgi:hypothetical protein